MRGKKTTLKYWLLEYKDGTAWKPAGETETLGDVVYNVVCGTDEAPATINASVVMANATDKVQFRLVCAAPISIEGKTLEQPANNSYVRIAPEVPIIIKGGAITENDEVIKPAFSIDKTELAAKAEGGNETIALTSNMSWTATSDADWASVLPFSGEASESAINTTVTVEANPSVESRSATLTYSATYGNVTFTKEVTVSQEGKEPEPVVGTDCDIMVAWAFSEGADMKGINSIKVNGVKCVNDGKIEDQTLKEWEKKTCPKFEIYFDKAGLYRYRLIAANGESIAMSEEGYKSKSGCVNGIKSVAQNAPEAEVIDETVEG
jgi:uncharacterized protein YegP (UPF0339 family)